MARIPYVERDSGSAEAKQFLAEMLQDTTTSQFNFRDVPNIMKALANSPRLAKAISQLGQYFMSQLSLSPRLRELAVLILMKRLNCEYGFVNHIGVALNTGVTREQLDHIDTYQTSPFFSDDDKLVLRYAEELTLKAQVDDQLFRQVEGRLGMVNVLDLNAAVGFWNMMARNLNGLRIDLEPERRP
ncbi:MAG: carboxymuconolactone decarboxylase family protein [Deltaproteobacteria bacterium]|jgi:4-carboxymuconolactone decarboxylase|nr:carboxymuconolactone decarboxylase family protein [Deltaproteobacteria bacterium]